MALSTFEFPGGFAYLRDASAVPHPVDGHLPKVHLIAGQRACVGNELIVVER